MSLGWDDLLAAAARLVRAQRGCHRLPGGGSHWWRRETACGGGGDESPASRDFHQFAEAVQHLDLER
ncbi:MAG: hypothetical protein ACK5F7_01815, partial [Planctomycetaceae bacterium]